jgi:hypothetical protein
MRVWSFLVDCSPLVLAPDEKKASSDTEATDSEPTARAQDPPARPVLGGGLTMISRPSVGPLDTVTGEPYPMMAPASPTVLDRSPIQVVHPWPVAEPIQIPRRGRSWMLYAVVSCCDWEQ